MTTLIERLENLEDRVSKLEKKLEGEDDENGQQEGLVEGLVELTKIIEEETGRDLRTIKRRFGWQMK